MSKQTLSKSELISAIQARHPDLTKKAVGEVVDTLLTTVAETIAKGDEINIAGFGKFCTAGRAARIGRNPQTGAEIKIAASVVPKFTPSKALKSSLARK
jgi:DNA-binding protein HU-beta